VRKLEKNLKAYPFATPCCILRELPCSYISDPISRLSKRSHPEDEISRILLGPLTCGDHATYA